MLKYQYRINNSVRLSNGLTKWVSRTVPLILERNKSDEKDNQNRGKLLAKQERDLLIHDQVLDSKADRDQGCFDM